MQKFIAASAAVIMATALATPAFADDVSVNTSASATVSASVASGADLACMGTAVDTREAAVISARTAFNTKIMTALETRRASLKTAYTIANNADRKIAIKTALTVYAKATADARFQYKTDVKAAWKTFTDAVKTCNVDASMRVKEESRDEGDRGLHLGQLKKQVKNTFGVNAHGKADIDLSF